MRDVLGHLDTIPAITDRIAQQQGASSRERDRQRQRLSRRLSDLEGQRQRLLDLVIGGTIDPALYGERDAALKAEISSVRAELDATPATIPPGEVERRYGQIQAMREVVDVLAADDPSGLVPMLAVLEARYVIGGREEPARLEVGEHWRAFFRR